MKTFSLLIFFTLSLVLSVATASASQTVKLLQDIPVYSNPDTRSRKLTTVKATRPITGNPTYLPVINKVQADGQTWVRVYLPQKPNGSTGWVNSERTIILSNPYHVIVNRSKRTATILKNNKKTNTYKIVVGKKSTPTPTGTFFITEKVPQPHGSAVGPYVLATSAYSNVLQEFDGGPGQIGLHGRTNLPGALGTAASHGCIRFSDSIIRKLNKTLPEATTITIK